MSNQHRSTQHAPNPRPDRQGTPTFGTSVPRGNRRAPCIVFAYGSNLFQKRMAGRIPSATVLGPAVLPGHELRFHMQSTDGSAKADAYRTADPTHRVAGVLYRISPAELSILDHYEGGYTRQLHPFRPEGGEETGGRVRAWTYHARPERIDPELRPFDWYHRFVVAGARSHGIDPKYVERLTRIPVVQTGGQAPHLLR